MEGVYFAKTGKLLSFSEQQLIDCDIHDHYAGVYKHNNGCKGGDHGLALIYLFDDASLTLEDVYPYTSGATGDDSTECLYSVSKATNIKNGGNYEIDNDNIKIKTRIQQGPIATTITANNKYIHSYVSGVIDAEDCIENTDNPFEGLNPINHVVTIVGYGTDEATGLDYWLVKNSWSATWGDKGYVKIHMEDSYWGVCGIKSNTE